MLKTRPSSTGGRNVVTVDPSAYDDVAVIAAEPVDYPNGRAVSRSMDNRLGCYVAYEVARLVAEAGGAPGDVAGVAVAPVEEVAQLRLVEGGVEVAGEDPDRTVHCGRWLVGQIALPVAHRGRRARQVSATR